MPSRISSRDGAILIIVGIVLIAIFNPFGRSESDQSQTKVYVDKYDAKFYAEQKVKTLLKAPSTAVFSDIKHTTFESILDGYKVVGYVDAQNSFGAMIRSKYSCEVFGEKGSIYTRNAIVE